MFVLILTLTHVLLSYSFDAVNRDFLQPFNESEVLAIDSNYDNLAVATRENIYIFSQDPHRSGTEGNLLGRIALPSAVHSSGYIELKLLAKQQVFYCDKFSCRFCTLSRQNSSCGTVSLKFSESKQYATAAVTRTGDKIVLRVVDSKSRAAILTYDAQDSGSANPDQEALDKSYIINQQVLIAFTRGHHAYFVGSSTQPNEPFINARFTENENISLVKVSRICGHDKTSELESRIDQALTCPGAEGAISAVAAHYDRKIDQLMVIFQGTNKTQIVCQFDMNSVDKRIDSVWDDCQGVNIMDSQRDCQYLNPSLEPQMKDHCYVFTRKSDDVQTCLKFGLEDNVYKNCELHMRSKTSYRYGWLENFKPFTGTNVGRMNLPIRQMFGMYPDIKNRAMFVVVPEQAVKNVLRLRIGSDYSSTDLSPVLWQSTVIPSSIRSISTSSSGDALYLSNNTRVSTVFVSCSDLYKTCDSLAAGGWQDPLSCVWCPDEDKNQVISSYDKFNCHQPLSGVCPPVLDHANRDQNHSEWQVFGQNLDRLNDSVVYVCGQPCTVNKAMSTNVKLHCFLADGSEQDSNCEVKVAGKLGSYHGFSLRANKVTNSVGVSTEVESSAATSGGEKSSKAWKAVVAVVAVILILGALGVIIWFARKRMMNGNNKADDDNNSSVRFQIDNPMTILPSDPGCRPSNSYVPALQREQISLYERIYRDIDETIKIPVRSLSLEKQIGKGHFGLVHRATYTTPGGSQKKVACKIIKDNIAGVRDFIAEGLIMANFDHPRLLQLIGISMDEDRMPIIVTDYMAHGDLVTYLKNKDNSPTLRTLLTFAIEIAQGMEYLHSQNFIHRDLAARNCMLDNVLKIKIADFGLCRQCNAEDNTYEPTLKNRDLPLRWMPIESLEEDRFTLQGDVWAYGVVLWELMTRGLIPYGSKTGVALLDFLRRGERLEIPPYCPVQLYEQIMLPCWHEDPMHRPTFSDLVHLVEDLVYMMERSQNTQLYSHYERVSTTTPSGQSSANTGSGGFGSGGRR